jgi:hypothetical protein
MSTSGLVGKKNGRAAGEVVLHEQTLNTNLSNTVVL